MLLHELGPAAIAAGSDPVDALLDFMDFVGDSPVLAFHAPFDQHMLTRALKDSLGYRLQTWGLELAYRPGDFVQVNAGVNEAMVAQALAWLDPQADERVLDLFCGLGNFALPLARQVREVVAVEGVATMVERAAQNAVSNNLHNAAFFQADLDRKSVV